MDSLSRKIALSLSLETRDSDIPISMKNDMGVLFQIDGELNIFVNEKVFFCESVAAPEFLLELRKWLLQCERSSEQVVDFAYETIDYDGNEPILEIKHVDHGLMISSIWQEFVCDEVFEREYVFEVISHFCDVLEKEILQVYKADVKRFQCRF